MLNVVLSCVLVQMNKLHVHYCLIETRQFAESFRTPGNAIYRSCQCLEINMNKKMNIMTKLFKKGILLICSILHTLIDKL